MRTRTATAAALLALLALLAVPLAACGDADAAPLEVTYYYLPG